MQAGDIYRNKVLIGEISKGDDGIYSFHYLPEYLEAYDARPISVAFPLSERPFTSTILFAFFFNMLAEGDVKEMQCRTLRIDEDDHFTRLLKTAGEDAIGSITVREKNV